MRFLSLALLSGCALVDASGDPKDGGSTTPRIAFDVGTIPDVTNVVAASIGQVDSATPDLDAMVIAGTKAVLCKNQGAGIFASMPFNDQTDYSKLVVDDLNGDGSAEIVLAGEGSKLHMFVSNGTGFDMTDLSGHTLGSPRNLVTGSFPTIENQSPRRAIVASYNDANEMRVIARLFDTPMVTPFDLMNLTEDIIAADVTANGNFTDEIVVSLLGGQPQLLELSVENPATPTSRAIPVGSSAPKIAGGELGDPPSDDDIVYVSVSGSGPSSLRIKLGSQTGLENDGPQLGLGSDFVDVETGDFDGDGRDDIVGLVRDNANNTRELHVFLREPSGQDFSDAEVIPLTGMPDHLVVGTFDGDGKADLLVFPNSESGVDVLLSR